MENNCVVYFTKPISIVQLKKLLKVKNFGPSQSRILVLSGIHGQSKPSQNLHQSEFSGKKYLDKWKTDLDDVIETFRKNNLTLIIKDISNIYEDKQALSMIVKEHDPNVIVLGFCFSDRNKINHFLRSAGVYAELNFKQDLSALHHQHFNAGKLIKFDNVQKDILERFMAQPQPNTVTLTGHYGTGKTTLLKNMIHIKVGQIEEENASKTVTHLSTANMKLFISKMYNIKRD